VRTNPFYDTWLFLIGSTPDHDALGAWKYVFVVLFIILLVASVAIAVRNWRNDPSQRTGAHLATWFIRTLMGCMWFQGVLWKLPLFTENGLYFWTKQEEGRAAFEFHRELVTNLLLPYFNVLNPIVFVAELAFAVSLMLGLGVRIVGLLAALFALQLWLGLYVERPGDIAEWPWNYLFLAALMFFLSQHDAGRSLGLDALIRRRAGWPVTRPAS
jgi:uncharacterized membrane protein